LLPTPRLARGAQCITPLARPSHPRCI
jgi:hypothetical protein